MNEEEMMKIIKDNIAYDISEEDKKRLSWEYIDISHEEFHEFRNALIQLLDLYNQEKESHKLDNENYKILRDDVTALAKYMGLEETAIIDEMYEAFDKEKEKNKKLERILNNLAKAVKFMGTNDELTTDEIIKMFSPEEIKMNFDDFIKRWEKEQHKKSDLKDKVIDLMAQDYIQDFLWDERSDDPCDFFDEIIVKKECTLVKHRGDCKECIKQYYFKKARGEEDVK